MPPAAATAHEATRIAPPVQDVASSEPPALDDLPLSAMPHAALPSIDAFLSASSAEAATGNSAPAIGAPHRSAGRAWGILPLPPAYGLEDDYVSDPGKTSEPLARSVSSSAPLNARAPELDADPVDHERSHLVAADPFEEPFLSGGHRSAPPEPLAFDEGPELIKDFTSDDVKNLQAASYAESPTIGSTTAPVVSSQPEARGSRRPTPRLGIPPVAPELGGRPVGQARMRMARGTPQRVTPIMSMRTVTPMSTPGIPRTPTPVIPATPVRSPTPIAVSSLTPRSIPALVDIANARAAAEALESVAASIRAGHLIVSGNIPGGTEPEAHAAALAAVLAALLGVRH